MDQKELEQLVELGKNAALFIGVITASAVGAWRSIKSALKPLTHELTTPPPSTSLVPQLSPEDSPTLKATAVRIEDRVKGLEDSFKEMIASQNKSSESVKEIIEAQHKSSDKVDHFEDRINLFGGQIDRFGDQMNLLQEQVNTIHRHLLNGSGRSH